MDIQYRYTKNHRLKEGGELKQVMNNPSTKLVTESLVVFSCEKSEETPRFGIIISKRNIKTAVARNRVKRLARESFRLHQHQLVRKDIVIIARKMAETLSNAQLAKHLDKQWERLTNIRKK